MIEERASGVEAIDGDPKHNQQWIQRSYGARDGWPAFSDELLNLQVEWRPILFLPALMPRREAVLLEVESVVQPQRSRWTKWFVPGAGDDWIHQRAVCTRSLFPFLFGVLSVRFRDLVVISSFLGVCL